MLGLQCLKPVSMIKESLDPTARDVVEIKGKGVCKVLKRTDKYLLVEDDEAKDKQIWVDLKDVVEIISSEWREAFQNSLSAKRAAIASEEMYYENSPATTTADASTVWPPPVAPPPGSTTAEDWNAKSSNRKVADLQGTEGVYSGAEISQGYTVSIQQFEALQRRVAQLEELLLTSEKGTGLQKVGTHSKLSAPASKAAPTGEPGAGTGQGEQRPAGAATGPFHPLPIPPNQILPAKMPYRKPHRKYLDLEPITYEDAFKQSGGELALESYRLVSKNLTDFTRDKQLSKEIDRLLPADFRQRVAYSTINVNQDYVESFEELYSKAEKVFPFFAQVIETLASKTNGTAQVPPLKGKTRSLAKANFKYTDSNGDTLWYRITDLVRATLHYPDIDTVSDRSESRNEVMRGNRKLYLRSCISFACC
jgi:hypothetical protein